MLELETLAVEPPGNIGAGSDERLPTDITTDSVHAGRERCLFVSTSCFFTIQGLTPIQCHFGGANDAVLLQAWGNAKQSGPMLVIGANRWLEIVA